MADSLKRMNKVKEGPFQLKNEFYVRQKAESVLSESTPDPDDLKLAKAVFAGTVNIENFTYVSVLNSTIGTAIDAGSAVAENDIEYVWISTTGFHDIALSLSSAGLI